MIASTILMVDLNTAGEIDGMLRSEARATNPLVTLYMVCHAYWPKTDKIEDS